MTLLEELQKKKEKVVVVGLGYVGLPLAVALSQHFNVVGFDINERRISELKEGIDRTREVEGQQLVMASILFTSDQKEIHKGKFIIVAVPTPIDDKNKPDLTLVEKATATIGKNLSAGSIVVYESTVYPGVTEDVCIPILAEESGLTPHIDFKVGYSPERINPGDKEHTINRVIKVVSAEDTSALEVVAGVYGAITQVFRATSIKVAEAAKVIENTQRDLNIALMNELSLIFDRMGFSVFDVLEAASTKWNFLNFKPGLVGGHCIGVDPYYLTHRAEELGYTPEVILAGRKINDAMAEWIADRTIERLRQLGKNLQDCTLLVCGITFKENIPDVRNSKVALLVKRLAHWGVKTVVVDPLADPEEVNKEYNIILSNLEKVEKVDGIVLAVAHEKFINKTLSEWQRYCGEQKSIFVDIKGVYHSQVFPESLSYLTL